MTEHRLFDPGLQPERTALAWRRTVLALAIGAVFALRLLPPVLGPWSIAMALAGILSAAAMWILAGRRARQVTGVLLRSSGRLPGGWLLLQLSLTVAGGAAMGLVFVVAV